MAIKLIILGLLQDQLQLLRKQHKYVLINPIN